MVCCTDDELKFYIQAMDARHMLMTTMQRRDIIRMQGHLMECVKCQKRKEDLEREDEPGEKEPMILLTEEDLEDRLPRLPDSDEEGGATEEHGYYPDDRDQT